MAEYNDVIKQFKRMCRYYYGQSYSGCPLYCKGHGCNISHCRMLAFEDKKFQNVVMLWAAEHPEPVYPTWGEWLEKQGVVKQVRSPRYEEDGASYYTPLRKIEDHIPPDVAQMLGIEPKEGT